MSCRSKYNLSKYGHKIDCYDKIVKHEVKNVENYRTMIEFIKYRRLTNCDNKWIDICSKMINDVGYLDPKKERILDGIFTRVINRGI